MLPPAARSPGTLGQPLRVFRPSRLNLAAGVILAVLAVPAGAALLAYFLGYPVAGAQINPRPGTSLLLQGLVRAVGCSLGLGLIAAGPCLLAYVRYLSGRGLEVYEGGLRVHSGRGWQDLPWAEVGHVRRTDYYYEETAGTHRFNGYQTLDVRTTTGGRYHFNQNHLPDINAVYDLIAERLSAPAPEAPPADAEGRALSRPADLPGPVRVETRRKAHVQRGGVSLGLGAGLVFLALLYYLLVAEAERGNVAGGEPLRLPGVLYLAYLAGGKWLLSGVLLVVGGGFLAHGIRAWRGGDDQSGAGPDPGQVAGPFTSPRETSS